MDTDLKRNSRYFFDPDKGAYFIHSAGYVNLSTDEEQREKILMKTLQSQNHFQYISSSYLKFIYIGTAFFFWNRKR
jgi:hypothetical protein